jgi:hypothetical protein
MWNFLALYKVKNNNKYNIQIKMEHKNAKSPYLNITTNTSLENCFYDLIEITGEKCEVLMKQTDFKKLVCKTTQPSTLRIVGGGTINGSIDGNLNLVIG